ncbi:MAG: sulfatase-like hydrolase/transferase [Planctomycetia bacterium]|nr:sulfatase-like hydrolase/transferase [Planctomycetia bacterium]
MLHVVRAAWLAGLALLCFSPGALAQAEPAAPPNVILCMTDDQGWGDVSYNGLKAIKTANLDAMAAASLRLDRFYAAAPVCSPTRGSVLTGRHPNRFGCFLYGHPLRTQEQTVAQALRSAGYVTGHFGKWHLNGVSGPGKVIRADDPLSPGAFGFDEWLSVTNYFDLDWTLSRKGTPEKFTGDGSDYIVGEALKFTAQTAQRKKPFLAVIWFGSPHDPHRALPDDLKTANGSAYHGEILALDRAMGKLRGELRQQGLADDTLVWFCSDNGATGPGSTGGLRGKKGSVWEGGVRVPGLVEWPARIRKPFASAVPACTSDIYPTLLDLIGVKVANPVQPLDGISLQSLFDGKLTERPQPIGFWHYPGQPAAFGKNGGQVAWTENQYKLVRLMADKYELYDLKNDPNEKHDLSAEKPDEMARMKKALDAWQDSVLKSYRGEDYPAKK